MSELAVDFLIGGLAKCCSHQMFKSGTTIFEVLTLSCTFSILRLTAISTCFLVEDSTFIAS